MYKISVIALHVLKKCQLVTDLGHRPPSIIDFEEGLQLYQLHDFCTSKVYFSRCLNQIWYLWNVMLIFLESQDSGYLYFCFRWLLIRFKREFSFQDILRLWEVSKDFILQNPVVFWSSMKYPSSVQQYRSLYKVINRLIKKSLLV